MKILVVLLCASLVYAGVFQHQKIVTWTFDEMPDILEAPTAFANSSSSNFAIAGQFPFVAEVEAKFKNGTSKRCTGTLISSQWIITSLQCVRPSATFTAAAVVMYFGEVTAGDSSSNRQNRTAIGGTWIENGKEFPDSIDIALFKLSSPFTSNAYIAPINLPTSATENFTGANFTLVGWTYTAEKLPDKVQYANFTIDSTAAKCGVGESFFCASLSSNSFEPDIGSSYAVYDSKNVATLVGVQSGNPPNFIFGTNILKYLDFIKQTIA